MMCLIATTDVDPSSITDYVQFTLTSQCRQLHALQYRY